MFIFFGSFISTKMDGKNLNTEIVLKNKNKMTFQIFKNLNFIRKFSSEKSRIAGT